MGGMVNDMVYGDDKVRFGMGDGSKSSETLASYRQATWRLTMTPCDSLLNPCGGGESLGRRLVRRRRMAYGRQRQHGRRRRTLLHVCQVH